MKFQAFEILYFQMTIITTIITYGVKHSTITSCFYLLVSCLFYMHVNLVTVKLWSDF